MNRQASVPLFYKNWLWLLPTLIGGGVAALLLFVLEPDRTLHGFADFGLKIMPLLCAVWGIALFPQPKAGDGAWGMGLVLGGYLFYMGIIDSAFVLQIDRLIKAAVVDQFEAQFAAFYMFNLFVNAFIVLFALFAYRLGGGRTAPVLKLGLAGILVMISGLNDLTMWVIYPWPGGERPLVFDWASHVAIFIGRPPNLYDMLVFLTVHLLFAVVILWLPLQRWVLQSRGVVGLWGRAAVEP